ncbi:MAG: twin-arginine translocase TatA/TatE family subunit [Thermodesulfobacteriota bacterium]
MFGIGMPELLLILAVALIVLGPKKLPELARSLGKGLAELKKSTEELKGNLNVGDEFKDLTNIIDPLKYLETLTPNPPEVNQEVKPEVEPEVNLEIKPEIKPAPETSLSSSPKASDV